MTSTITTTVQGSASTQYLSHDAAGRLLQDSGSRPSGSWRYDGRGNLASAITNGVTRLYSYSATNPEEVASTSISGQPAVSYGYDGDGNTTSISNGTSIFTTQTPATTGSGAYEQ